MFLQEAQDKSGGIGIEVFRPPLKLPRDQIVQLAGADFGKGEDRREAFCPLHDLMCVDEAGDIAQRMAARCPASVVLLRDLEVGEQILPGHEGLDRPSAVTQVPAP